MEPGVEPSVVDDAVGLVFREHYAALCRIAGRMLGDAARAEEIVMDAFASTLRRAQRLADIEAVHGYVRQAVVNGARSSMRRQSLERRVGALMAGRREQIFNDQPAATVLRDEVGRALLQLPARQRAAIVLTYYGDLSTAQTAALLSCSQGTVKSQLARGRNHLQRILGDQP